MKLLRNLALALLIVAGLGLLVVETQQPAQAQGENLLVNPSFEGAYSTYDPEPDISDCPAGVCTTVQLPAGWWPWWVSQQPGDPDWKNRTPEYKPAEAPFLNRVQEGQRASQYFTFYGTHTAGLWQRVSVPANANLQFAIWGQAWSNNEDPPTSDFPTNMNMRVGIDPTGGTNPFSPAIVWSPAANAYDAYVLFTVQAQAQGDTATVFTWSAPEEQRKHNDVYWDNASLTVVGAAPPPPPPAGDGGGSSGGTAPPPAPAPTGPTPTPNADGVILVEVRSGDSLWSVAARAGISLDTILELNNIGRSDFINAGDLLIIGYGDASTAEDEAAESTAAEEDVAAEAGPEAAGGVVEEATPEAPAATAEAPEPVLIAAEEQGGTICLKTFADENQNGLPESGEAPLAAVAFTISNEGGVVSNYVTSGSEVDGYCIEGLDPGTYRITRSTQPDEVMTTPGDWAVTLIAGQPLQLTFGSYVAAPAAAEVAAVDNAAAAAGSIANDASAALDSEEAGSNIGVIVVVVIAVLLLVGVVLVILSARRTAA
jgi:hypothetical protein